MQAASRIFQALQKGGPTFGAWQMLPGRNVSRALAGTGIDWVCVDCEHGNVDDAAMHEAVSALAASGVSPIVRIPGNEGWMVKRALDSGAHGVVVPLLNTPQEVETLVRTAKFPPTGIRGFGSPFPMSTFPSPTPLSSATYLQQANTTLLTIIQIETSSALQHVDTIAAIPGVDVLFIGPFDLGINIGHPIVNNVIPKPLEDAILQVKQAADTHGKKTGMFCTSGAQSREWADKGFDMISIAADFAALGELVGRTLAEAKGGSKEGGASGPYGR
ncbi:MAG: hypothetical protein M1820_002345 [Bogoriella megaspora]|nr:MAG: hypothetical protein M1820_002345 [Bogoriella megaspora]